MSAASNTSQACATNPSGPGCSTAASAESTQPASTATSTGPTAATGGSLDVADSSGLSTEQSLGGSGFGSGDNIPKINTIANNSGGGIPGGAGGGNGGILGGNGAGGLFGAAKSSVTDIEQGMRSGGYSAPGGSGLESPDGEGGFAGYGTGAQGTGGRGLAGIDLKDYLPGGRLAVNGIHTGAILPISREIGGPHVDLWSRITDRLQLMCKLGELFDCK